MKKNNSKINLKNLVLGGLAFGTSLYFVHNLMEKAILEENGKNISTDKYMEEINFLNKENYIDSDNLFDQNSQVFQNSHKLFQQLLIEINRVSEIPNKSFTISDITKLIPFSKNNFFSEDEYYHSLLEILSNPLNPKYFHFFENAHLENILKLEFKKNNITSNDWISQYSKEKFKINEEYYNSYQ